MVMTILDILFAIQLFIYLLLKILMVTTILINHATSHNLIPYSLNLVPREYMKTKKVTPKTVQRRTASRF